MARRADRTVDRLLLQRYVPGVAASVSLLADGRRAVALTVNAQSRAGLAAVLLPWRDDAARPSTRGAGGRRGGCAPCRGRAGAARLHRRRRGAHRFGGRRHRGEPAIDDGVSWRACRRSSRKRRGTGARRLWRQCFQRLRLRAAAFASRPGAGSTPRVRSSVHMRGRSSAGTSGAPTSRRLASGTRPVRAEGARAPFRPLARTARLAGGPGGDGRPPGRCAHHMAVTMTAELADCFATKREGVVFVLDAFRSAFPTPQPWVYGVDGRFHRRTRPRRVPLQVAAANWRASAALVARSFPDAIFLDVGSTTTDVIPIVAGRVAARGRTDPTRLRSGRARLHRSAAHASVRHRALLPLGGRRCRVAAEHLRSPPMRTAGSNHRATPTTRCDTPDGRGRSRDGIRRPARPDDLRRPRDARPTRTSPRSRSRSRERRCVRSRAPFDR